MKNKLLRIPHFILIPTSDCQLSFAAGILSRISHFAGKAESFQYSFIFPDTVIKQLADCNQIKKPFMSVAGINFLEMEF